MEDDDLADNAQIVVDAIDNFLLRSWLIGQLDPDDQNTLRVHRGALVVALTDYRGATGYTHQGATTHLGLAI
jgi:hypothetical protein